MIASLLKPNGFRTQFNSIPEDMSSSLPPDLFDQTTVVSLLATVLIVLVAYGTSCKALAPSTSTSLRFLFIWHLSDALCHFVLEGSFLYHCFFSFIEANSAEAKGLYPTAYNYLGWGEDRIYGPQSGGENPLAALWMVYARADKRWAGADLVRIDPFSPCIYQWLTRVIGCHQSRVIDGIL